MFIPVRTQGTTVSVLVDDEDAELVLARKWHINSGGYVVANGRMVDGVREPQVYLHRLIASLQPGDGREVDHKNRNRLDNRRDNLVVTTHCANMQNVVAHRDAASQHRGVWYDEINGSWVAQHMYAGQRWTQRCATEDEAALVVAARREAVLHG